MLMLLLVGKPVKAELPGYEYAILNELQQMMYVAASLQLAFKVIYTVVVNSAVVLSEMSLAP